LEDWLEDLIDSRDRLEFVPFTELLSANNVEHFNQFFSHPNLTTTYVYYLSLFFRSFLKNSIITSLINLIFSLLLSCFLELAILEIKIKIM
jgi:hypothetical protein